MDTFRNHHLFGFFRDIWFTPQHGVSGPTIPSNAAPEKLPSSSIMTTEIESRSSTPVLRQPRCLADVQKANSGALLVVKMRLNAQDCAEDEYCMVSTS